MIGSGLANEVGFFFFSLGQRKWADLATRSCRVPEMLAVMFSTCGKERVNPNSFVVLGSNFFSEIK